MPKINGVWIDYRPTEIDFDNLDTPRRKRFVSLRALFLYYKGHARAHPFRELFAVLGIAAGVALLFAVQVANKSVTGSFGQLSKGVAGHASLEVASRSPEGFDQGLYRRIERLSSVAIAAPILEQRIAVRGPKGRQALTLVGADDRLGALGGKLITRAAERSRPEKEAGLQLTAPTAKAIGASQGGEVELEVGERLKRVPVAKVVGADEIGELSQSPIAVAPLFLAQEITGLRGRLSRVLVAPAPGGRARAQKDLTRIAHDRLNVRPADTEAKLLDQAAAVDRQSSALFAAISLIVGILLAYNAMLLSMAERRRFISNLHSWGAFNETIVSSLLFDALILGVSGSLVGLVAGDLLSRFALHETPAFLTFAFPIGSQRVVELQTVALAFGAGVFAALLAAARPAAELLRIGPQGAFAEHDFALTEPRAVLSRRRLLYVGAVLIAGSAGLMAFLPRMTLVLSGPVIVGILMMLPALVSWLIARGQRAVRRTYSPTLRIALGELAITPTRSTALAAIGALAVYAVLAITGPANDLTRGQQQLTGDAFSRTDLWVSVGTGNVYRTDGFTPRRVLDRIGRVSGVAAVQTHTYSFLDLPDRRIWVLGLPPQYRPSVAPTQVVEGDAATAERHVHEGGWAVLTATIAAERGIRVGDTFALPTPRGKKRFRLAATISNYGWFPGAALMGATDYGRFWNNEKATLLGIRVQPASAPEDVRADIQAALGAASPLRVQTNPEREAEYAAFTRQGLTRLRQISNIVIIAVVLAVAAAMLGAVWLRRKRLWSLVSMGMGGGDLYRTIFVEATAILLLGCLVGGVFGLGGQFLADRWLVETTGSPVSYAPAWDVALRTLALITVLAVAATAIPLRLAFPVRRRAIFSPE